MSECQKVIYYDISEDVLVQRCTRTDDNMETLLKRFQAFNEQSKPVVDLY